MKKLLAPLTLAAAILVTPVAAQTDPSDPAETPAAQGSTSTTEADGSKNLAGTVVSSNATELVLRTAHGQQLIGVLALVAAAVLRRLH
ncbi:MAG: hypothetical protein AMXMBFR36_33790 [Acidobacteriota bacterium]